MRSVPFPFLLEATPAVLARGGVARGSGPGVARGAGLRVALLAVPDRGSVARSAGPWGTAGGHVPSKRRPRWCPQAGLRRRLQLDRAPSARPSTVRSTRAPSARPSRLLDRAVCSTEPSARPSRLFDRAPSARPSAACSTGRSPPFAEGLPAVADGPPVASAPCETARHPYSRRAAGQRTTLPPALFRPQDRLGVTSPEQRACLLRMLAAGDVSKLPRERPRRTAPGWPR
jgi:hypothetical protein